MNKVFKYQLTFPETFLTLPVIRNIRLVGLDPIEKPCIWVEADFSNLNLAAEQVVFGIHGTGHEIPEGSNFAGSFTQDIFVWHVYWRKL